MAKMSPGEIRLYCIGDARIVTPVGELDPSAEVLFGAALYLALEQGAGVSRRGLQELLWPRTSPELVAHRLRQTVFKLRKLGFDVESQGKSRIRLSAAVATDFEEFERTAGESLPLETVGLPLFGSYVPIVSAEFIEWFDGQNRRIAASVSNVLLDRLARARTAGEWTQVEKLTRAILRHTPYNEEATLAAAEALAMRGDKLQAVRLLDAYLDEVGGTKPDLRLSASTLRRRIAERIPSSIADTQFESPLVGRSEDLERLIGLISHARRRRPTITMVSGDPGIGKSRLISEFIAFASLQGVAAQRVYCRESDSKRPLSVLLELIPLLIAMRGSIGSSPDTLEFLNALTTHHPPRKQRGSMGMRDPVHPKLDLALADILDAVTEETLLILCIEDYQWIDNASASVFERLRSRLNNQRLVLLLTSRITEDTPQRFTNFNGTSIHLSQLSDESSSEVVLGIAKERGVEIDPTSLAWCTSVAEGNPFFLQELAKNWIETRDHRVIPHSLASVLDERLSRLSDQALQVLQTCALLENNSNLDTIEDVLGYPAHDLLHCLDELGHAGMIIIGQKDSVASDVAQIRSRHDLLSNTALRYLTKPARAYLHRRAAKVLESRIQDKGDASTLWSCAKHWQLAGDGTQAFRLAQSCANHLLDAELPTEAGQAFSKALDYCVTDLDRLSVFERQSVAYYQASDWTHLSEAAGLAREIKAKLFPELGRHDDLELMQRRARWKTTNAEGLLADSLKCVAAVDAPVIHRLEAGVLSLILLTNTGDSEKAHEVFRELSVLCGKAQSATEQTLEAKMIFHTTWGSLDKGVEAALALVALEMTGHDVGAQARALTNAAVALRVAGRFDEAYEHLHQSLALADRHRIVLSKTQALRLLGYMAIEQGRIEEARGWVGALTLSNDDEDEVTKLDIGSINARIALAEGRYTEAVALVDTDLSQMRFAPIPNRRQYWYALRVATELATTGKAGADSLANLEHEHRPLRKTMFQAFQSYALYAGLVSVGESRKAKLLLEEYLTKDRREPWPAPQHILDSLMGLVQTTVKKKGRARRQLH